MSNGNVLIGTTTDNGVDKLKVSGSISATAIKLTTGATNGYILTSDASGNGSWQQLNTGINNSVQSLSGTTVTWNMMNGQNATITLTGATTITMSNLTAGEHGSLTATNGGNTGWTIAFSGYTFKVHTSIRSAANTVVVSGGTVIDHYSWYYDGTNVIINGGLNFY
jgi:hypothetical protein